MTHKRFYLEFIGVLVILIAITGCTADSQVRKTPVAGMCNDSSGIIIPEDVSCYFENAAPISANSVEPNGFSQSHPNSNCYRIYKLNSKNSDNSE